MMEPLPLAPATDVLIVGGGPAGLYAAFYAALRGVSVRLIEARPELGGQLSALYPDRRVYDVPAAPNAYADQLVAQLVRQLTPFAVDVRLGELVTALEPDGAGWVVGTDHQRYPAGAVILAAGLGALRPRPAPEPGMHTDWPQPGEHRGQRVWVQGGVPQATQAALQLHQQGAQVTLSHRRALFRGTPRQLEALEQARRAGGLQVVAAAAPDWQPPEPQDARYFLNSYLPDLTPLQEWPLGWQGEYVPAGPDGQTRLPGVYVAGDLSSAGADFKLISVAFAQAALCANHAVYHVRPELKVRPGHSSDRRLSYPD
ncbi:NAD(P)/FAD-dependent oxidoreductase [Deinococcus sonorensis]|uniref:Ferredoxin--NADP reductase n=2 Tax=Deinococcus sonorensis TaxID=309891 RepID=A0AAU7U888_9DEIO